MKIAKAFLWMGVIFGCLSVSHAGQQFGDVLVSPQPFYSGDTFHGYGEFRILLENHSARQPHQVTLDFPERSYGSGNRISRITRNVLLGPNSQTLVPFWQPPLPVSGNGSLEVRVDGALAGAVPVSVRHAAGSRYYGSTIPATILVSRSVDYDDAIHIFRDDTDNFSPDLATGPTDTSRTTNMGNVWMPDRSAYSSPWLELNYAVPQTVDHLAFYETESVYDGEIILIGVSGVNCARIPITAPTNTSFTFPAVREFSFPLTAEPIRMVRLEFGRTPPVAIAIDAVAVSGPAGKVWASSASASSSHSPSGRSAAVTRSLLHAEQPVGQWSDQWLSYTPFDGILLGARDLAAMPAPVAAAVWSYAEAGGRLVILGTTQTPEPCRAFEKSSSAIAGGRAYNIGFGQCFVFKNDNVSTINAATVSVITSGLNDCARYWQSLPDPGGANRLFPVVDNIHVPVRSTLLVMLVFVILIGPVNLFVLSRKKRRVWMLWTIPAISLVSTLLVLVYSLVHEGITPSVRLQGITLLDQAHHRATSYGLAAFYCPLTPGQGLKFGYETEVTPLVPAWEYSSGTPREMDWTQAQELQRGWVTARVPAHFHLRKSETRRERIEIEISEDGPGIVNGLGVTIRNLWLADASGHILTASNVRVGQKAKLSRSAESSGSKGPEAFLKAVGSTGVVTNDVTLKADFLLPGTYIADVEANPFLETALAGRTRPAPSQSGSWIFGVLDSTHGL